MFDLRAYLERANIYYPPDVSECRHQRLVGGLNDGLDPALVAAFLPQIEAGQTVVWSAEGFSHNLYRFPKKNLDDLVEATRDYDRKVFLVIRQREKFLWSLYKQCLINPVLASVSYYGQNIPFEDFIELPYIRKLADFPQLSRDLSSLFQGEVTVLDYDALDLGEVFEQLTGVAMPPGAAIARVNTSFPDAAVDAVRRVNATLAGRARDEAIARIVGRQEATNV
jgi:hypothetical protein